MAGTTNDTGAALLLIDLLNHFDFPGADGLHPWLDGLADAVERLRAAADGAGMPVVYVNDHDDQWHCDRERIVDHYRRGSRRPDLVDRLRPRPDDYFVVKPHFSGFYATTLPVLLPRLGARRLVLTGVATDICVLFTAADAHMRGYGLRVPSDTTACCDDQRRDWALDILQSSMGADTLASDARPLGDWLAAGQDA